jgi:hypothetical protein
MEHLRFRKLFNILRLSKQLDSEHKQLWDFGGELCPDPAKRYDSAKQFWLSDLGWPYVL